MKLPPHGGDTLSFTAQYGRVPLDFSANTNPLGMSPLAQQAIVAAVAEADRYPDPHCRAMRQALAVQERLSVEEILCGNGAADLIYRLVLALRPRRALVTAPSFGEYEAALLQAGCRVEHHILQADEEFRLTKRLLAQITPGLDLLFLCEPNNPTGICSNPSLVREVTARCAQNGTVLVIDECFNGFLADPEAASYRADLAGNRHLLLLKAFTKLYGLAGVRLGYLLGSDRALLQRIAAVGPPWSVSTLAQAAGLAALQDADYLQRSRALIAAERARMQQALLELGYQVYAGEANYLFFRSPNLHLAEALAEQGIMIRDCANYPGLKAGYYRVAIRQPDENNQLLQALIGLGG